MNSKNSEKATLGGGCFWCTEAIFQAIKGVKNVVSGYSGGIAPGHPTYREVCSGLTGHAEVVQLTYDTHVISYKEVLTLFMTTHDPTTLHKQGADTGSQYRSAIFYHNEVQKEIAEQVVSNMESYYDGPIVTEVSPLKIFYEAEEYHQDYYRNNKEALYCKAVINPKLSTLREAYGDKLKKVSVK